MKVIDVFFEEKAKQLISSFCHCFKVCISIFSADVRRDLTMAFYPLCRYCKLIREELKYDQRCVRMDYEMCLLSVNTPPPPPPMSSFIHAMRVL
jgi:ligand-binding sensor protein